MRLQLMLLPCTAQQRVQDHQELLQAFLETIHTMDSHLEVPTPLLSPPCSATTPGQVPISVQHLSPRREHPLAGNPAGRLARDNSRTEGPGKSFQERLNPAHGQGFMSSPIEADAAEFSPAEFSAAEFSPAEFSGEEFSAEEMPLQIVGTTDRGGLHVQGMQQNNNPRQGDLTAGVHNPGEYQGQRSSSIMDRLDLERGRLTDNRSVHQGGTVKQQPQTWKFSFRSP